MRFTHGVFQGSNAAEGTGIVTSSQHIASAATGISENKQVLAATGAQSPKGDKGVTGPETVVLDSLKDNLKKKIQEVYKEETSFENNVDLTLGAPSTFEQNELKYHEQWKLDEFTLNQCASARDNCDMANETAKEVLASKLALSRANSPTQKHCKIKENKDKKYRSKCFSNIEYVTDTKTIRKEKIKQLRECLEQDYCTHISKIKEEDEKWKHRKYWEELKKKEAMEAKRLAKAKMMECMRGKKELEKGSLSDLVDSDQQDPQEKNDIIRDQFAAWCGLKQLYTDWYLETLSMRDLLPLCDKCSVPAGAKRMDLSPEAINGIDISDDFGTGDSSTLFIQVDDDMTSDADTRIVYQIIYADGSTAMDSNKVSNVMRLISEQDLIASKEKKVMQHQATCDCKDDDGAKTFCDSIREGKEVTTTFTVNVYSDESKCCVNLNSFSYSECIADNANCGTKLTQKQVFKVSVTGTNYKIIEEKKVNGKLRRRLLTTMVRGGGGGC